MHCFLEGVYTSLVQQCGMCPLLKKSLFWVPNCLEPMRNLLAEYDKHMPISEDEDLPASIAPKSSPTSKAYKSMEALDREYAKHTPALRKQGSLEDYQGGGAENEYTALPVQEQHQTVLVLLGVCASRMMPDHPCGLKSFLSGDDVHTHLSKSGLWSSAHLALHLLTMIDICLSESGGFSADIAQEITKLCIKTLSRVDSGVDQAWIMSAFTSYKGYSGVVDKLSSNRTVESICHKGILPLLNKALEVAVVEDGTVLNSEDEENRLLEKTAWFLPYILLFPVSALKQLLHVAVTNTSLLELLCKVIYRLKPIVALESPGGSASRFITAIQSLMQDSKDSLDTDSGSAAFADLFGKIFDGNLFPTMDAMRCILIPCLKKYMGDNDVPVKAILSAINLLSKAETKHWTASDKPVEEVETTVDLVVLLCKVLMKRPCALSWGCPVPQFVPLSVIEVCDEALGSLLSRLSIICEIESDLHLHHLEALLQEVNWPARVKVLAWLDSHKRLEIHMENNRDALLPKSLEKVSVDFNDAYCWAQLMEDVCSYLSECGFQCHKLSSCDASSIACLSFPRDSKDGNVHQVAETIMEGICKCPPHLLSWCAVMTIARILPFMTSRESLSLCLGGLPTLLSKVDSSKDPDDWCGPESLHINISDVTPICTVVELICRAIHCLSAHEDVLVVNRGEAVTAILMRLSEIGEGVLQDFRMQPQAVELVGGRFFSEICGLLAAIQEYYSCDVIQVSKVQKTSAHNRYALQCVHI